MLRYLFELTPVALALVVSVVCSYRYGRERRMQNRLLMLLGMVNAVLLIVAQTSWWTSFLVQGAGMGTEFADVLWSVFNNLVMVSFLVAAHVPRHATP